MMRGLTVAVVLLAAAAAGAEEAPRVALECALSVARAGGEAVVVSRPKVETVAGRAAMIESTVGAGDGKPGHRIAVALTPRIEAGAVQVDAVGSLTIEGGARVDAVGKGAPVAVALRLDDATRYAVTCDARLVER